MKKNLVVEPRPIQNENKWPTRFVLFGDMRAKDSQ